MSPDLKLIRVLTEVLNIPAPFISEMLQHVYSGFRYSSESRFEYSDIGRQIRRTHLQFEDVKT